MSNFNKLIEEEEMENGTLAYSSKDSRGFGFAQSTNNTITQKMQVTKKSSKRFVIFCAVILIVSALVVIGHTAYQFGYFSNVSFPSGKLSGGQHNNVVYEEEDDGEDSSIVLMIIFLAVAFFILSYCMVASKVVTFKQYVLIFIISCAVCIPSVLFYFNTAY